MSISLGAILYGSIVGNYPGHISQLTTEAAMLDLVVDNVTGDTVTYAPAVNDTTTIVYRLISSALVINNRC